jgi:site-specific DNA-adenine methylase
MRPFFSFFGGKWRATKHYPFPRYKTIIEPFAGSAGYSVHYHDRQVILVEIDPKIASTWRYLIRVKSSEILSLPDIADWQNVNDLSICEEAKFLIGWWLNAGMTTPCNYPSAWMRSKKSTSFWGQRIRERIATQVDLIRHWKLIEGDYREAPDIRATWFIDPPYEIAGKCYKFHNIDYSTLSNFCKSRDGDVIVCENEGADWLPFKKFRNIQGSPTKYGAKVSKEVIWFRRRQPRTRVLI